MLCTALHDGCPAQPRLCARPASKPADSATLHSTRSGLESLHNSVVSQAVCHSTHACRSECWRAPAAVMVREVAPAGLGSTAGALNLCVRGLAGALGPVGIAQLSAHVSPGKGRGRRRDP